MSKRILKLSEGDYKHIRSFLIPIIDSYENPEELTIIMNSSAKYKIQYNLEAPVFDYLFGVKIKIANIKDDVIILSYGEDKARYMNPYPYIFNGYGYTGFAKVYPTLPDRYIVNNDACILFYENNKTIVKRHCKDRKDPVKAFLWAYFLKHTGMSRTKANKYLKKVHDDYINNIKDTLK